ncbi:MAG: hypothetical protein RL424_360 [Pseudomonadota bacterium]
MHSCPMDGHAIMKGAGVGVKPGIGRQERRVNIDDGATKCIKEGFCEYAHKASENDKPGLKLLKQSCQLKVKRLTRGEIRMHEQFRREALFSCPAKALRIFPICNNKPVERKPLRLSGPVESLKVGTPAGDQHGQSTPLPPRP